MEESTRRTVLKQMAALGFAGIANDQPSEAVKQIAHQAIRAPADFFPGFRRLKTKTSGAVINAVVGGKGSGLLLLHGYPQTHIVWRRIAHQLAEGFTVVVPDLRGYGDSSKPADREGHSAYSKRAMALDQVELMRSLGFEKFVVVGHDRGGRVAHRMALDHAGAVEKVVVLDIVPTYKLYHSVTKEFATAYFHWFFLIQLPPFPETLIGNNVEFYLKDWVFKGAYPGAIDEKAFAEYLRCFRDPAAIHASCEDYRAAASVDLEHDAADLDRKVSCPLLALWAEQGAMQPLFDVLATWRERASNAIGKAILGGHYLPEETPQIILQELTGFLK